MAWYSEMAHLAEEMLLIHWDMSLVIVMMLPLTTAMSGLGAATLALTITITMV